MKAIHTLALPPLALGAALLLLAPGEPAGAFSKIGGSLGVGQRDFRVFNNFADPQSNNNTTPDPMFPGYTGAMLAIWKGFVEWGSLPHGDGSGDPTQPNLGDGGANFDPYFAGEATGIGGRNHNIVSAVSGCSGGTLAYAETPIGDGWRIRFCDNHLWGDGPDTIKRRVFDIQSVAVHEFGHALGLGHSSTRAATMFPSGSSGSVGGRSIHPDDIAGVQCIYGVRSGSKPVITATEVVSGGSEIKIHGGNFDPSDNEVWFTRAAASAPNSNPFLKVTGASSSGGGTLLRVAVPAEAGPGDVLVAVSGGTHASVSNAFPTDLMGTIGDPGGTPPIPFQITSVQPGEVEALIPGTQETVTIQGHGFTRVQKIFLNLFTQISPSRWTIVDDNTITIDMPQSPFLGPNSLTLDTGSQEAAVSLMIVEPATPKLELGTGDPGQTVTSGSMLTVTVSGEVGARHRVYYSPSGVPSKHASVCFDMGNGFRQLFFAKSYTIGASGWEEESFPIVTTGAAQRFYCQSMNLGTTLPFEVSNLQSVVIAP